MRVNGVDVLDTVVTNPLVGTAIGVMGYGPLRVEFSNPVVEPDPPVAFVAMPFEAPLNPIYDVIRDVAENKCAFRVVRGDEIAGPGSIIHDIQRKISEADVVIAELTEVDAKVNANVYYEVGFADGLNKPVILLVGQKPEAVLPFDIRGFRVIHYDDCIGGKRPFEEKLRDYLNAVKDRQPE
jgi:hypothetical protein